MLHLSISIDERCAVEAIAIVSKGTLVERLGATTGSITLGQLLSGWNQIEVAANVALRNLINQLLADGCRISTALRRA